MGKTIMGAVVSLDGFIADDDDRVGPLFDMTDGWNGKPAAGEHVFVVTHQPPTDWEYADTAPFTFVDGVETAIAAAKESAGDRVTHLVYDVSR
jgi:dihydrofolate reductase